MNIPNVGKQIVWHGIVTNQKMLEKEKDFLTTATIEGREDTRWQTEEWEKE